jgi:hypothetical protein
MDEAEHDALAFMDVPDWIGSKFTAQARGRDSMLPEPDDGQLHGPYFQLEGLQSLSDNQRA